MDNKTSNNALSEEALTQGDIAASTIIGETCRNDLSSVHNDLSGLQNRDDGSQKVPESTPVDLESNSSDMKPKREENNLKVSSVSPSWEV